MDNKRSREINKLCGARSRVSMALAMWEFCHELREPLRRREPVLIALSYEWNGKMGGG